jgi:uncharacterized membrane protein YcaP (DUF421 family)
MGPIIRATAVYLFLLLVFRIAGNRSIAQITAFDFVLLLIISEAVQQAMITNDYSLTNAFLIVIALVGLDIMLSLWKQRSKTAEKVLDGVPVFVMRDGQILKDRMKKERVDEEDILAAARESQGLENMDDIKHAIIEVAGAISIIPRRREPT